MDFQEILYTKEEGIATITLNRPQALNAVTPTMQGEWLEAVEDAKGDREVRVLVVTGAGRAFCSGANPRALAAKYDSGQPQPSPFDRSTRLWGSPHRVLRALAELDKPYIGSINGPAAGGGMDMASMCDIRIASDRARFRMAYVRMGITSPNGGCYFLPRLMGIAKAAELIWTGRTIDAWEALRIGYVSKVVPHEELPAATKELALKLAQGPATAIQLTKRLIYRCLHLDLNAALEAHESAMLIAERTEEAKEGLEDWSELL